MDTNQLWSDVAGFESYYRVSNDGLVFSVRRGRLLKGSFLPNGGYRFVRLYLPGQTAKTKLVHRLVAVAFLGQPQAGQVIRHKSRQNLDNRVENLEWVNRRGLERKRSGEKNPRSKLTQFEVDEMRVLRRQGETFAAMARRYDVSAATIQRAVIGKSWKPVG